MDLSKLDDILNAAGNERVNQSSKSTAIIHTAIKILQKVNVPLQQSVLARAILGCNPDIYKKDDHKAEHKCYCLLNLIVKRGKYLNYVSDSDIHKHRMVILGEHFQKFLSLIEKS